MKIIGWIREGDRAACGATVMEGDPTCRSHGRAYAFVGARMACPKNCVIAQGFVRSTLTNGRAQVIHGMKTSRGCPLVSTLNDIDGVGSEGEVHAAFAPDADGGWRGISPPEGGHEAVHDEYFIIVDKETQVPARNRMYRITLDSGEIIEGQTDDEGRTKYATSDKRTALKLELAPQGEIQIGN